MKRGRPTKRFETHKRIIEILSNFNYPLSILKIAKEANMNWGTTKKYLKELVNLGKVKKIEISTNKRKIILYALSKGDSRDI